MANQTITWKAQKLNIFGPSPSTKWGGTFNWTASSVGPGNGTWGYKSAACMGSQPIIFGFSKLWSGSNSTPLSSPAGSLSVGFNKVFNKTLNVAYANSSKQLTDGSGYYYIYNSQTNNAENQFIPSFTSLAASTTSFTCNVVTAITYTSAR